MKAKIFLMSLILGALLLFSGTGTALADGRGRGHGYGYHNRPVVVRHVHRRVVYHRVVPTYGRTITHHHPVYVYPRPVIVRHAPVYAPVLPVWGLSIHFGY